jgi:hypothetical protein
MLYKHNNILSDSIRQEEDDFNQMFLNSLKLSFDINQYEGKTS